MNRRRFFAVLGGAMAALRARGILAYPTHMQPGIPYCERCTPEVFPTFGKLGVYHAARNRFPDDRGYDAYLLDSDPHIKLFDVYEAYQGATPKDSWVIRGYHWEICPDCHGAHLKRFLPGFPIELQLNGTPVR